MLFSPQRSSNFVSLDFSRQSCIEPRYSIMNAEHSEVLNIEGPICVCSMPCGWDREFKVSEKERLWPDHP